jgi:signal peptidase I
MLPTVQLQDHVMVSKLAYGVHIPLLRGYVARFSGPARGDVVVLTAPDTGIVLLKRVAAVPGDRVRVHDGALEVNGEPVRIEERDGRYFGFVDRDAILGHVAGVLIRGGRPTWIGL